MKVKLLKKVRQCVELAQDVKTKEYVVIWYYVGNSTTRFASKQDAFVCYRNLIRKMARVYFTRKSVYKPIKHAER